MTTVSLAGDLMDANNRAASAAMNRVEDEGKLFNSAFVVADWILLELMSIPREDWKSEERVMVNKPLPEYASIRCVMLWLGVDGRICSRMY